MVILQRISKILESWQTFAASNNIRNHLYFQLKSVKRKWIGENHPKAVSKPPIQKLFKFTFKKIVFVLQYIK